MKPLIAAVVFACTLTACAHTPAKPAGKAMTVQHMADRLGCTYEGGSTELFVKEGGPCGGWNLYNFTDNKARDSYVQAAQPAGGVFLQGDRWVVVADSSGLIDEAKGKLGGTKLP